MAGFSDMISYLRKRAGLTQGELADKLGCSRSIVAMWEQGRRVPPLEMLENVADFFNVDMNTLTGGVSVTTPLTPTQAEAWEVIKGMNEEDLRRFIQMAKVRLGK